MNDTNNGINKEINKKHMSSEHVDTDSGHSQPPQQCDQEDFMFYHEKAYQFLKTLKRDYKRLALIYNSCLFREQERERKNKQEILELKQIYHQMQSEKIIIKRTKWCHYCESEATYISSEGNKFYCSPECEQKQMEFTTAIESSFKS